MIAIAAESAAAYAAELPSPAPTGIFELTDTVRLNGGISLNLL